MNRFFTGFRNLFKDIRVNFKEMSHNQAKIVPERLVYSNMIMN